MTSNEQIATITFVDHESGDEALAVVRRVGGLIALSLSLKHNGDHELAFEPQVCEKLAAALIEAASSAKREGEAGKGE